VKQHELTPYAVLLARSNDTDDTIRGLYHVIARRTHPDAITYLPSTDADATNKEEWHAATSAYTAIKTAKARDAWERSRKLLSGLCAPCRGEGVQGTRRFKGVIRLCAACGGTGRA
jgi:DnaJ-class molecular chaperone